MAKSIVSYDIPYFLQFLDNHPEFKDSQLREACAIAFGVTRRTIYDWTQKTPRSVEKALRFAERIAELEKKPITHVLKNL